MRWTLPGDRGNGQLDTAGGARAARPLQLLPSRPPPLRLRAALLGLAGLGLVLADLRAVGLIAFALLFAAILLTYRPGVRPAQRPRHPRQRRPLGLVIAFAALNLAWRPLRRLLRPDYLWVVYPGGEREKRLYCPRWLESMLRPLMPSALLRFGRYWGLMVAGHATAQSLEDHPEKVFELLEEAREEFPHAHAIALAGRLPSLALRTGVALEEPFVRGDRGTLCAMLGAAREQARMLGRDPVEVRIAVPGGAGFIGSKLVAELARSFEEVIALDPRYREGRRRVGNVVFTHRPEDIERAQAVLVLTRRGSDSAALVPFLAPGAVVADDTHPEIPRQVREQMAQRGARVLKAAMADERFKILPRIPTFNRDDIPGCLLEALVVVASGTRPLGSQQDFNRAAEELGLRARLAPHLDIL